MAAGERTATQTILLAANDLSRKGKEVFTEWDLTVEAWRRDPARFGCRGYEDKYPDHKRVMMEIMSRKKRDNPLRRGHMEKVRPNYYSITSLGKAEAERLDRADSGAESTRSPGHLFDAVAPFANHRTFRSWLKNPEEPRTWLGAAAFLDLAQNTPTVLQDRLRTVKNAVKGSIRWCQEHETDALTRGSHGGGRISLQDLHHLSEFVSVLEERFDRQIAAIMQKG